MKGIIMAGGSGTRLYPMTQTTNKHLLAVYDKPMIYYPLTTLISAGIKEILLICTPQDKAAYQRLLGNGERFGIQLDYAEQQEPKGIAEAFIIAESFIAEHSVCLILGDNIFYGHGMQSLLQEAVAHNDGATIFGYYVNDPERYGVISFNSAGVPEKITEKPTHPDSNYAVTGLYVYDNKVVDIAKALSPSARGELEITDVNKRYLENEQLKVVMFDRGIAWLDTGTPESLLDAAHFVHAIESRQGLKVGCPEEMAWRSGFINDDKLRQSIGSFSKSDYGAYLMQLLNSDQPF